MMAFDRPSHLVCYGRKRELSWHPPPRSVPGPPACTAMAVHQGIWKWVVPPVRMNGMFDDHDPMGLVAGKLIPADGAFNGTDPDTHRLICFTTATSFEYLLGSPQMYRVAAQENWRAPRGKLNTAR